MPRKRRTRASRSATSNWTDVRRPLLLGHRGARRCAPENTLIAFDLALAHGCDGFEFDVRRSADGCGVICHDALFRRARIVQHTYASLLERAEPLLSHVGRRLWAFTANRGKVLGPLCRLEDVLGRYAETAFLDIEVKDCGLEETVARALGTYRPRRFVVSSYLPEVITKVAACAPDVPLGLIAKTRAGIVKWRELPVSWVALHRSLLTPALVDQLHREDRQAVVWTVNSEREMLRVARWGVDAIISDDAELLSRTFSEI